MDGCSSGEDCCGLKANTINLNARHSLQHSASQPLGASPQYSTIQHTKYVRHQLPSPLSSTHTDIRVVTAKIPMGHYIRIIRRRRRHHRSPTLDEQNRNRLDRLGRVLSLLQHPLLIPLPIQNPDRSSLRRIRLPPTFPLPHHPPPPRPCLPFPSCRTDEKEPACLGVEECYEGCWEGDVGGWEGGLGGEGEGEEYYWIVE
jgi:hypothetical protein